MRKQKTNRRIALILALLYSVVLFAPLANAGLPVLVWAAAEAVVPIVVHAVGRAVTTMVGVAAGDASFASVFATFRNAIGLIEIAVAADRIVQIQVSRQEPIDHNLVEGIFWDVSSQVWGWNGKTPRLNGYAESVPAAMQAAINAIREVIPTDYDCVARIQEQSSAKYFTRGNSITCANGFVLSDSVIPGHYGEPLSHDKFYVDIRTNANGGPTTGRAPDGKVTIERMPSLEDAPLDPYGMPVQASNYMPAWKFDYNDPDIDYGPMHLPLLPARSITPVYQGFQEVSVDHPANFTYGRFPPDRLDPLHVTDESERYRYLRADGTIDTDCCLDPSGKFINGERGVVSNFFPKITMPYAHVYGPGNQQGLNIELGATHQSVYLRATHAVSASTSSVRLVRTNALGVPIEFFDSVVPATVGQIPSLAQLYPVSLAGPLPLALPNQISIAFPSDYVRDISVSAAKTALIGSVDIADPQANDEFDTIFFGETFKDLLAWRVPGHASQCPTLPIDWEGGTFVIDSHCQLIADHWSEFMFVMRLLYTLAALYIVLRA